MKITEINIYPIKSMGSLSLDEAQVLPAGLKHDRRWMLLNENGKFLTQRNIPEMALVRFKQKENGFDVFYKDDLNNSIFIPFEVPVDSDKMTAQVWDDKVQAYLMDAYFSTWFSNTFNKKCQLVRIVENDVRINTKGEPDKVSSFADGMPFSIAGEQSLMDLNSRLNEPVPMTRFRFNFIFSGGTAYEEDDWNEFKIGNVHFVKNKKCGRCKVVTIDQKTGIKMGEEPLATLSAYRKENRQINFGIRGYMKNREQKGMITSGDKVERIS